MVVQQCLIVLSSPCKSLKMISRLKADTRWLCPEVFNPRNFKNCFTVLLVASFLCCVLVLRSQSPNEEDSGNGTAVKQCKQITAAELLRVPTTRNGIPLILHQIYRDKRIPMAYRPFVDRCRRLNPDFVHVLWSDADIEVFLRQERPELQTLLHG